MKTNSLAVVLLVLLTQAPQAVAEELEAVLDWAQRTELSSLLDGLVVEVKAKVGDRVGSKEALVRLDDREALARMESAKASLEEADLLKAEADRELSRNQELYDRTVLSDHDLRMAEIGAARANAAWQQAQALRVGAQLELERSRIQSPFEGLVVAVMARPGMAVVNRLAAQPLVVVASARQMLAVSQITAERAASLTMGDEVMLQLRNQQIPARISHLAMEPQGDSGLYRMEASFDMPSRTRLVAGESARLILP